MNIFKDILAIKHKIELLVYNFKNSIKKKIYYTHKTFKILTKFKV